MVAEKLPTMVLRPSFSLRQDKTQDGWTLVEDTPLTGESHSRLLAFWRKARAVCWVRLCSSAARTRSGSLVLSPVSAMPKPCLISRTRYPPNGGATIWSLLVRSGMVPVDFVRSRASSGTTTSGCLAGTTSAAVAGVSTAGSFASRKYPRHLVS